MLGVRTALALVLVGLSGAACSNLIGLDEFKAADGTGGTSGVGAAGGVGGVGGSSIAGSSTGGGGSSAGGTSGGTGGSPECTSMASQSCYTGEPATLNKGICSEGTQKCGNDSMWGACTNEVLPSVEDCSVPDKDENCDGFECGIWGLASGGTKPILGRRPDGGVVVAAHYDGAGTSDPFDLPASNKVDAFVASLAADGSVVWTKSFGSSEDDQIVDIAAAPDGTTYVLVNLPAATNLGSGQLVAGYSLVSIDAGGTLTDSFNVPSGPQYAAIAADPSGNVLVCGRLGATTTFGNDTLHVSDAYDPFVVKFGPSGNALWARSFAGPHEDFAKDVVVDAAGNVIVVGTAEDIIDFGAGNRTPQSRDGYYVRLDPDGNYLDATLFGGPGAVVRPELAAVDSTGAIVLAGYYGGAVTIANKPLPTTTDTNGFVVRLIPKTNPMVQWLVDLPGRFPSAVSADSLGGVSLGTLTITATTIGGESIQANIGVLERLANAGQHIWHRSVGGPSGFVSGVGVTERGESFLTGTTTVPSFDLGSGEVQAGPDRFYLLMLGR